MSAMICVLNIGDGVVLFFSIHTTSGNANKCQEKDIRVELRFKFP